MVRKQKGFSLIELLIVVAIILIIAAIAIPNLLRAKIAANESSAVGSMRTLNTASVNYYTSWGVQYPTSMAVLGGPTNVAAVCALAELIDPVLAGATAAPGKSGYIFTYTGATATPAVGGARVSRPTRSARCLQTSVRPVSAGSSRTSPASFAS